MKAHLVACPACARHVRVSEDTCPFCQAKLSPELRATPRPRRITARLSRAALFALGTTGTAAIPVLACVSSDAIYGDGPPSNLDSGRDLDSGSNMTFADAYGAVPFDVGPLDDAVAPPYGSPPPIDSGEDATDAGEDAD